MKDMKEALSSGRKPDITHARTSLKVYVARAGEYGSDKYERANYMRTTPGESHPNAADFERFRQYLRAAESHISQTLDEMESHQANDPHLEQTTRMAVSAYSADTDVTPGASVGASGLPHIAHAACSIMMAIEQATSCGLLPADPGQPWRGLAAAFNEGLGWSLWDVSVDNDADMPEPADVDDWGSRTHDPQTNEIEAESVCARCLKYECDCIGTPRIAVCIHGILLSAHCEACSK